MLSRQSEDKLEMSKTLYSGLREGKTMPLKNVSKNKKIILI